MTCSIENLVNSIIVQRVVVHVYNNCKICVNDVTIISNRLETDFELATGMRMEAKLKNCLKWKEFCINRN